MGTFGNGSRQSLRPAGSELAQPLKIRLLV